MAKRRRGSRTGRPRSRHRPFEELVGLALDAIPEPFAAALDEVAIVIADEPTDEQRRENEIEPDETLYGLYEGVPRTEWGADWAALPNRITLFRLPLEEDFADPGRPRRRGLGDGHPRARPPPRHRRRPARPSSASTDPARRPGRARSTTAGSAARPSTPGDEPERAAGRSASGTGATPGRRTSGSRSPPGRTWSSPNVARVSPTNITTCGAIEIASAV